MCRDRGRDGRRYINLGLRTSERGSPGEKP